MSWMGQTMMSTSNCYINECNMLRNCYNWRSSKKKVCDPTHPTHQKSTQHIFNFKCYCHIAIIHLIYCLWQAELLMSYATKKGILRYKLNQVIYTYLSVIYYTCMFGIAFLGKLIILRNNPKDLCWKRIATKYIFLSFSIGTCHHGYTQRLS